MLRRQLCMLATVAKPVEWKAEEMVQWFPADRSLHANTVAAFHPSHLANTQRMSFLRGNAFMRQMGSTSSITKHDCTVKAVIYRESVTHYCSEIKDPTAR